MPGMTHIGIQVEDGIPPPMENGFKVQAFCFTQHGWTDTGITIDVPNEMRLEIEPLDKMLLQGYYLEEGRLFVKMGGKCEILEGDPVAKVWLVMRNVANVRFIEFAPRGGRRIRGAPQQIENSPENRDPES